MAIATNQKVLSKFMINWVANNEIVGKGVRLQKAKELGVAVPNLILIDLISVAIPILN